MTFTFRPAIRKNVSLLIGLVGMALDRLLGLAASAVTWRE